MEAFSKRDLAQTICMNIKNKIIWPNLKCDKFLVKPLIFFFFFFVMLERSGSLLVLFRILGLLQDLIFFLPEKLI